MRAISALMFFPRGGSAHVARALAHGLPVNGWDVTVVSGSKRSGHCSAEDIYGDLDVVAVDFDAGDAPMHPSYEDRHGADDVVFATVDDASYEEHVEAWSGALERARAADADVLHLHHLTPIHEAAARVAPDVPVVGHLHGTELLMLERIAQGPPEHWKHAEAWERRMRGWANRCERIFVLAEAQIVRAVELLGVDPERCVVAPNGFEPDCFRPLDVDRRAHWRRFLVDEPRGWRPDGEGGSVRYTAADVEHIADGPVLVCAGRFTEVKRTALVIRAFTRAREQFATPASLVLVGGHPGEWEGEHPADVIAATGARDVFLAGWHDHTELPAFFNACDVMVLGSVREQFGSVLVEAMGCGLPAIAVDRYGPSEIVTDGDTGWLVEPDDEEGLADAMVDAVNQPEDRRRPGAAPRGAARARYAWPALAERVAEVFDDVAGVADEHLDAVSS